MDMDDEILQKLREYTLIIYLIFYTIIMATCNTHNLFNLNELN